MEGQKIEETVIAATITLGTVTTDVKGKNWIFIGTRQDAKGPRNYIFVREGNPVFHYSCSYMDTLVKKFPCLAGVA